MIALYSQSILASYDGEAEIAEQLNNQAKAIFEKTKRQYYSIAQGTLWLDILEGKASKQMRII